MKVYKSECDEIIRRFASGSMTYAQCVARLDAAVSGLVSRLKPEDLAELQGLILAKTEIVAKTGGNKRSLNRSDTSPDSLKLRAEREQARVNFIRNDLDVCLTFASIAETEIKAGNREHAIQVLGKAEKGYADMLIFFSRETGMAAETRRQIRSKFRKLRKGLDALRRQVS